MLRLRRIKVEILRNRFRKLIKATMKGLNEEFFVMH